jgi:outer membrane pore protein F
MMYAESRNMLPMENSLIANKTQSIEAVVQYQLEFGLRPSLGYVYAKGQDLGNDGRGNAEIMNYVELGTWYYFNKNFNVYTAYKFNLLDEKDRAVTGAATDNQFALGIIYQF